MKLKILRDSSCYIVTEDVDDPSLSNDSDNKTSISRDLTIPNSKKTSDQTSTMPPRVHVPEDVQIQIYPEEETSEISGN